MLHASLAIYHLICSVNPMDMKCIFTLIYIFVLHRSPSLGCVSEGHAIQTFHGCGIHAVCLVGQCCAWTWPGVLPHILLCHNLIGLCYSSGITTCYLLLLSTPLQYIPVCIYTLAQDTTCALIGQCGQKSIGYCAG